MSGSSSRLGDAVEHVLGSGTNSVSECDESSFFLFFFFFLADVCLFWKVKLPSLILSEKKVQQKNIKLFYCSHWTRWQSEIPNVTSRSWGKRIKSYHVLTFFQTVLLRRLSSMGIKRQNTEGHWQLQNCEHYRLNPSFLNTTRYSQVVILRVEKSFSVVMKRKIASFTIYAVVTCSKCMLYLFLCLLSVSDSELLLSSFVCRLLFFFLLLCFLFFFCFFFKLQLCSESSLPSLDASSAPVNSLAGPEPSVALTQKTDETKQAIMSHSERVACTTAE